VTCPSEVGLRLPSLVFLLVAAFLVYRIAKRLVDAETARIAVIAFAVWPSIAFAASDARPYALATLVVVASTWALIGWLDTGRLRAAAGYVLLAALMPYVHPVFGIVLIRRLRAARSGRPPSVDAIRSGLSPSRPHVDRYGLLTLWGRREVSSYQGSLVRWVAEFSCRRVRWCSRDRRCWLPRPADQLGRQSAAADRRFAVSQLAADPTAILVGLSVAWSIDLLEARYLLCMAPAGVLLAAVAARALEPPKVRRIIVLIVVILSVLDLAGPVKSGDFRGAAALVRTVADARSVILVPSGFQESLDPGWFTDPERRGLLTAATSFYPVPGTVVPLPIELDAATLHLVRTQVGTGIGETNNVVVVTRTGSTYGPWFDEYMAERGWTGHHVGDVDQFTVTEFSRDGP
jgi:hypothetical protein